MTTIQFNNKTYQCRDEETVLDALLRQGVDLPFSCRKGSCHVCLLQCSKGEVSIDSQMNLSPVFVNEGYFLPCQCKPESDLIINEIDQDKLYTVAYVHKKDILSESVCRLILESDKITDYKAGQFLNMSRPKDGMARSYSIANSPNNDGYIELHIQRMQDGELSNWIFDELHENDEIQIQGPNGNCFYQADSLLNPILMVATGTGLAPLLGVLREAIDSQHRGDIHLYHEGRVVEDLYLDSYLKGLAEEFDNFNYYPCVSAASVNDPVNQDVAINLIHSNHSDLTDWSVYLAGSNNMVSVVGAHVISKGALKSRVFSDAFDLKDLRVRNSSEEVTLYKRNTDNQSESPAQYHEVDYPQPDLEIWDALDHGKKLTAILDDFYTIVYDDPRLSPFFAKITKQRSIEKVYLFLRQIFTGEKVYFGDRPRNAHHWMVISDELFDYREDIMVSCLRKHNIPEYLIKRWRAIEELFRPDIVKDKPWNKIIGGVEIPVEGFEELMLDSGTLCDSCQQSVEAGTYVRYHVRLGEVYCPSCMSESKT